MSPGVCARARPFARRTSLAVAEAYPVAFVHVDPALWTASLLLTSAQIRL